MLPHYTESINFLVDGMYFDFYDLQMYELSHQNWCFYHSGNSLPDWFTDWAYEIESEKDPEVKKEIIDNLPEGRIRKMMLEYLDLPPDLTDEQELFKPEKDKNSKVDRYKKWFKEVE